MFICTVLGIFVPYWHIWYIVSLLSFLWTKFLLILTAMLQIVLSISMFLVKDSIWIRSHHSSQSDPTLPVALPFTIWITAIDQIWGLNLLWWGVLEVLEWLQDLDHVGHYRARSRRMAQALVGHEGGRLSPRGAIVPFKFSVYEPRKFLGVP